MDVMAYVYTHTLTMHGMFSMYSFTETYALQSPPSSVLASLPGLSFSVSALCFQPCRAA